jgi:hypothetical protein
MWSKEFGIDFKTKSIIFKGLYITPKKDERNHIESLHAKHIFWLWWNLIFLEKGVTDNNYNYNWSMCGNWY